jgi:hypothetical protein
MMGSIGACTNRKPRLTYHDPPPPRMPTQRPLAPAPPHFPLGTGDAAVAAGTRAHVHTCTRAHIRAMGSVRSLRSKFKIRPGVRGWHTRTHLAAENAATQSHSEPRQDSDNENDGVDGQDQQEQGAVDWTHEEVGPPGEVGLEATTQPAQNTARQRHITCSLPEREPYTFVVYHAARLAWDIPSPCLSALLSPLQALALTAACPCGKTSEWWPQAWWLPGKAQPRGRPRCT